MKYSFLRYFELKSSQIWHKNVFKFFQIFGDEPRMGGGGTSLGPKLGTSVGWGGLANFRRIGGPPSPPPPGKETLSIYLEFEPLYTVIIFLHCSKH